MWVSHRRTQTRAEGWLAVYRLPQPTFALFPPESEYVLQAREVECYGGTDTLKRQRHSSQMSRKCSNTTGHCVFMPFCLYVPVVHGCHDLVSLNGRPQFRGFNCSFIATSHPCLMRHAPLHRICTRHISGQQKASFRMMQQLLLHSETWSVRHLHFTSSPNADVSFQVCVSCLFQVLVQMLE